MSKRILTNGIQEFIFYLRGNNSTNCLLLREGQPVAFNDLYQEYLNFCTGKFRHVGKNKFSSVFTEAFLVPRGQA